MSLLFKLSKGSPIFLGLPVRPAGPIAHRWAGLLKHQSSIAGANQQTSFFCFHLKQTNGSPPIPFSVCSKQTEVQFSISSFFYLWNGRNVETWTWRHGDGDMETWKHGGMETWRHGDMDMETSNGKTEAQAIFLNLFTICSSYKRKFVVCLLTKKQTEVIRVQTD
jgi:hypothetical protein